MDFPVYDLSNAIAGEELTPLQFDRSNYTPLDEFVENLKNAPDKSVKVSNRSLSVNGKVVNDSMEKYLNHPGLSSSSLKEALKTPRHLLLYQNQTFTPKNTSHFELGTFAHEAFLEPKRFEKVIVEPQYPENTNEGLIGLIRFYQQLLNIQSDYELSGLKQQALRETLKTLRSQCDYTIIEEDDKKIIDVVKSGYKIYGGGILPLIFKYAKNEVSMYGEDDGMKVKIRPDGMLLEENVGVNAIVSFKTTCANTTERFVRDAAKFKYELSEGMYLEVASKITGREFTATIMVMLQTTIPFQIAVFYWNAEDLQVGKYKYRQALSVVRECRDKKIYPGFDSKAEEGHFGIIQMKLPEYIKNELDPVYING